MAFVPTVKLVQNGVAMLNRPVPFSVLVSNSGATAANITGITVQPANLGCPCNVVSPALEVGSTVQLGSTSSIYFDFTATFFGVQVQNGVASAPRNTSLYAAVTTSDGSVTQSPMLVVLLETTIFSPPIAGQFRFDNGGENSYMASRITGARIQ